MKAQADVIRISAFSDGGIGGNPAGVYIAEQHPPAAQMQAIAADVGYSETAFAHPLAGAWRVRYFSPESEVPFCGHATIALGAAIAKHDGPGIFSLQLNEASITVEGAVDANSYTAALQSPETVSEAVHPDRLSEALTLFSYTEKDLNKDIPPAYANAGANHLIIALNSRSALADMHYSLDAGRLFMLKEKLITVMFVFAETKNKFHVRNAFASGGVIEDPATGAAAAAFAAYLRDIQWPHGGDIDIVQGEDMGARSLIHAQIGDEVGSSIRVSGSARFM